MDYDSACYDLAEHVLHEEKAVTEADRKDLAQWIQDAVEDWFFGRETEHDESEAKGA